MNVTRTARTSVPRASSTTSPSAACRSSTGRTASWCNYLWEIPGPKSGVLKHVLGGWQFSGVTAFQSGRPFTIGTGVDSNGDGTTGSDRPNLGSGSLRLGRRAQGLHQQRLLVAPLGTNNLPLANALGNGTLGRNSERAAATGTPTSAC